METPRLAASMWVTSLPPIEMVPEETFSRPAIRRKMVDLPHPEGPNSTVRLPSETVKETCSTARTAPPLLGQFADLNTAHEDASPLQTIS